MIDNGWRAMNLTLRTRDTSANSCRNSTSGDGTHQSLLQQQRKAISFLHQRRYEMESGSSQIGSRCPDALPLDDYGVKWRDIIRARFRSSLR